MVLTASWLRYCGCTERQRERETVVVVGGVAIEYAVCLCVRGEECAGLLRVGFSEWLPRQRASGAVEEEKVPSSTRSWCRCGYRCREVSKAKDNNDNKESEGGVVVWRRSADRWWWQAGRWSENAHSTARGESFVGPAGECSSAPGTDDAVDCFARGFSSPWVQ